MNDTNTDDLSHPGEWHIEKHKYSNAACTSAVERVYRGKELDSTIETRKWRYPSPFDKSPIFNALALTEEEWPSLAAWDGTVVEPDVPEIVDVTLRLYASVGLDEDNHESEYVFLGSGEERTYVHHTERYMYGADDHLYPETEWNGGAYYYQHPRSHWHNTRSKDDAVPVFNALIRDDQEWPTLSSPLIPLTTFQNERSILSRIISGTSVDDLGALQPCSRHPKTHWYLPQDGPRSGDG